MTDPIEPSRVLDVPSVLDVAVSPDGERAAFVLEEHDADESERRTSLHVVDTDGAGEPRRLTRTGSASAPRWGPDGRRLAFLGSREADDHGAAADGPTEDDPLWTGTDPAEATQLWVLDLEAGGDATRVTAFPDGARDFDWAPDGDRFVVAARDPNEAGAETLRGRRDDETPAPVEVTRLQHKADGHGWTDDVPTALFVVERERGDADRIDGATAGAGLDAIQTGPQPRWSPDGDRIAFLANHTDAGDDTNVLDAYTVRPDGTDLRKRTASDVTATEPTWSRDGERLAFVVRNPVNWYEPTDVAVVDVAADTLERVSDGLDRHVAGVGAPRWVDSGTLLAGIADEARVRFARLDVDGEGRRVFEELVTDRTVDAFDVAGDTVVALVSDPADGTDLYAFDAGDVVADRRPDATRLTAVAADVLADLPLPDVRRVVAAGDGGHDVEAVVATPPGFEATGDAPLLVQIHGGPIWHDTTRFRVEDAFWTSRGYVVVHPNYRGSYGYGREFCESISGDWGPREVADVEAVVGRLVADGWVDPDRVFATGFSYGGIVTAWLLTRTDLLAAGAPEAGVYDFRSAFGTDQWHEWTRNEFGLPWEHPERYRELSSIDEVDRVDAPVLVTAGGADWNCPPTQAEQLHVSLRKAGTESKLVVYPDEPHRRLAEIERPSYVTHRLGELASWFETHDPGR